MRRGARLRPHPLDQPFGRARHGGPGLARRADSGAGRRQVQRPCLYREGGSLERHLRTNGLQVARHLVVQPGRAAPVSCAITCCTVSAAVAGAERRPNLSATRKGSHPEHRRPPPVQTASGRPRALFRGHVTGRFRSPWPVWVQGQPRRPAGRGEPKVAGPWGVPSSASRTLAGLRSRWTMPALVAPACNGPRARVATNCAAWAGRLRHSGQLCEPGLAVGDILHSEIGPAVTVAEIMNLDDIRVLQTWRTRLGLALKACPFL